MISKVDLLALFIKRSPNLFWLKEKTLFLTLHGSRAYGTNNENSDYDFKGVAIRPKEYLLGTQFNFEQAILSKPDPDATIFDLHKFVKLATTGNPNIIEILFTDPNDHLFVSELGQKLLDNKHLFLSKNIRYTFCGYAYDQLRRLENHKRWLAKEYSEPSRASLGLPEKPLIPKNQYDAVNAAIKKDLEKYEFDFLSDCPETARIAIRNAWFDMLTELKITKEDKWMSSARRLGLSDNFIELFQKEKAYEKAKEDYKNYCIWKKNRNPERYQLELKHNEDLKHKYHLVRLLRMAEEMISAGKVLVKRPDAQELLDIRNGVSKIDNTSVWAKEQELKIQKLYEESNVLPRYPDYNKINKLIVELTEASLNGAT